MVVVQEVDADTPTGVESKPSTAKATDSASASAATTAAAAAAATASTPAASAGQNANTGPFGLSKNTLIIFNFRRLHLN